MSPENAGFEPQIIEGNTEAEKLVSKVGAQYVDAFSRQIKELFFIDNHKYIGTDKEAAYKSGDFKKYLGSKKDGFVHVYYPWNQRVVKCVREEDFYRLKTNRNQDLITASEQKILYSYKVAVLGMSVGSNIAHVLTQSGISREIVLVDFDELDTTNTNRILAGVHEVGENKAIIAARKIYEGNPFAHVGVHGERATIGNLEGLLKDEAVSCIVEEIDDIPFKIHSRVLAMKYKVPVVMITDNGDGVVLHIERYDLGHDKVFGKDPQYFLKKIEGGPMTREVAGDIIANDIVGGPDKVDPRMLESVKKVFAKELVSWSQLGSAAILGGVIATVAIKGMALGLDTRRDVVAYINPKF